VNSELQCAEPNMMAAKRQCSCLSDAMMGWCEATLCVHCKAPASCYLSMHACVCACVLLGLYKPGSHMSVAVCCCS
jgi:hypothetical protein